MKVYYKFTELPETYQHKYREGFDLNNLQNFYPAKNARGTTLFTLIALGIPAIFVVILGVLALFQPMGNPPKNTKEWLIFAGIAAFVLLILGGIAFWVYRLFKGFMLENNVRKINKEQGRTHYGLLLDKHLVYRPISIKNQIAMLPRESVRRVELGSERVEGSTRKFLKLIFFDEDHQKEYHIEMSRYELDDKYTGGRNLRQIIEKWR